jgi:hypothetical protein
MRAVVPLSPPIPLPSISQCHTQPPFKPLPLQSVLQHWNPRFPTCQAATGRGTLQRLVRAGHGPGTLFSTLTQWKWTPRPAPSPRRQHQRPWLFPSLLRPWLKDRLRSHLRPHLCPPHQCPRDYDHQQQQLQQQLLLPLLQRGL